MGKHGIWLIANWKMNGTKDLVREFCTALADTPSSVNIVLCPPFPLLGSAPKGRVALGAQNCHHKSEGAFTGEVSAKALKEIGCTHVIVGHSERREQAGETDALVLEKAQVAIAAGLTPIICVGEKEGQDVAKVLTSQLAGLKKLKAGSYLIAYEPVWAIGSGKTPGTAEISAAHRLIKTALGSGTPVLYGGSVKSNNLREILRISEVAGALIGGASLDSSGMREMVKIAEQGVKEFA